MVTRVHGGPRQGVWFSADVRFLNVTVTGATFVADLAAPPAGVNSSLELVLEAIATRGTVIALAVASATVINVMVDYAQAFDAGDLGGGPTADVIAELEAAIDALAGLSAAAIVVEQGFEAAPLS